MQQTMFFKQFFEDGESLPRRAIRIRVLMHALRLAEGRQRHLGGNFYHVLNLAKHLVCRRDIELLLLGDSDSCSVLETELDGRASIVNAGKVDGVIAADWCVADACRQLQPDIYHRPTGQLPMFSIRCPAVATIADLNFATLNTGLLKRFYKEISYRWTVRRADVVTCVSNFTRAEVIRHLRADPEKVAVVHHGATALPLDAPTPLGLPRASYWLAFGHQPHKNVELCLAALARRRLREIDEKLVVVGRSEHIETVLKPMARRLNVENGVIFIGHVSSSELGALYRDALGLLFTSNYEGFGLPILEAMSSGCPVVISDAASLPEIAGGAALQVGRNSVEDLIRAMSSLREKNIHAKLVEAGKLRAAEFSWKRAADETVASYNSAIARWHGTIKN